MKNGDRTVMTGLVPVISAECKRIRRRRHAAGNLRRAADGRHVDGRDKPWDKPGHDGSGGSNALSFDISRIKKSLNHPRDRKTWTISLRIWIRRNLLKSHKTAKTFLGKAWHWNHRYLEMLGKKGWSDREAPRAAGRSCVSRL
jgi:hypothetical protein